MTSPVSLVFFPVTGYYNAVADPSISGVIDSPVIQPISALVTFTPRLPQGQLLYISDYLVTPEFNAEQTVNLIGNPTGGTWTLQYGADITDPPLAWDIAPADLQTALEALGSIGSGNVTVVADPSPQAYDLEFTGTLGNQAMAAVVGDASLLTNAEGEGFCEVTTTVTAMGSDQVTGDAAIALPALTARIWNGVLSTIDRVDTPGFQLLSNSSFLNLDANNGQDSSDGLGDLIYDVSFTLVSFNNAEQVLAPFAFQASTDTTPVCLTDPNLEVLPWQPPIQAQWTPATPSPAPLSLVSGGNWRTRVGSNRRAG
jgi:hypothetical protein